MKVAERPPSNRQSKGSAGKRKVRVPQNAGLVRFLLHPAGKIFLTVVLTVIIVGIGVFVHYYNLYSKMIDERLRGGAYSTTARIYAAPDSIAIGDKSTPSDVAAMLRHAGYNENRNNSIGSY